MKLYFVQHGIAKSEKEDINRPLNLTSVEQTKTVAMRFVEKKWDKPGIIFCSKKLRTKQTAQILMDIIKPEKGVEETANLNPDDSAYIWFNKIKEFNKNIMIVGHLPHLKNLYSLLVFENIDAINFVNSAIIYLDKTENGWVLTDIILPY